MNIHRNHPDGIIFRIPDDDEPNVFVMLEFDENEILSGTGMPFTTSDPNDSYNDIDEYTILLVEKIDGGSVELMSCTLFDQNTDGATRVCDLTLDVLQDVADTFCQEYMNGVKTQFLH